MLILKTGIVLEGGGFRGIYTAGVLDVFMENKISFDGLIGVCGSSSVRDALLLYVQVGNCISEGLSMTKKRCARCMR